MDDIKLTLSKFSVLLHIYLIRKISSVIGSLSYSNILPHILETSIETERMRWAINPLFYESKTVQKDFQVFFKSNFEPLNRVIAGQLSNLQL